MSTAYFKFLYEYFFGGTAVIPQASPSVFITASELGSDLNVGIQPDLRSYPYLPGEQQYQRISNDFVGLNTNITEPITASLNLLGHTLFTDPLPGTVHYGSMVYYLGGLQENRAIFGGSITATGHITARNPTPGDSSAHIFNGLMHHRNGPYQHPSWKQIRGAEHPVARRLRLTNTMSVDADNPVPTDLPSIYRFDNGNESWLRQNAEYKSQAELEAYNGQGFNSLNAETNGPWSKTYSTNPQPLRHYYEPVVISKYKPFRYNIAAGDRTAIAVQSLSNQMHFFTNDRLNEKLRLSSGDTLTGSIGNMFSRRKQKYYGLFQSAKSAGAYNFIYSETIFPREINAYRAFKLQRPNFEDIPGTGLRGYDKQWGTQNFFWVEEHGDTQTSAPSNGTTRTRTDEVALNSLNIVQETIYQDANGTRASLAEITASVDERVLFATGAGPGFNSTFAYAFDGLVLGDPGFSGEVVNTLTGAILSVAEKRSLAPEPLAAFVQNSTYSPLPLSLLSTWPLDPQKNIYAGLQIYSSSHGGVGTQIGLTPHQLGEIGPQQILVGLSATESSRLHAMLNSAFDSLQTGTGGELVYSTKPTIFFHRNNGYERLNATSLGAATVNSGGYAEVLASAQYHRHTFPYNTPFYATQFVRGEVPNYDSYVDFSNLVKEVGRDFAYVPEFNISDHMEYYSKKLRLNTIRNQNVYEIKRKKDSAIDTREKNLFLPNSIDIGTRLDTNLKFLDLRGAEITSSSPIRSIAEAQISQFGDLFRYDDLTGTFPYKNKIQNHVDRFEELVTFNQKFSHTDTLSKFSHLSSVDNGFTAREETIPSQITIRCSAVKKGRIKNGFLPATRTLQIVKDFEKSLFSNSNISLQGANVLQGNSTMLEINNLNLAKQALIEPLFAPGLLYNSIKSGIAVDWPIYIDFTNGDARPPIYYAPQEFISGSSLQAYVNTGPHSHARLNPIFSQSFNYGGGYMLGSSRATPAILNNIPNARLPFRALYDYSALSNALSTKKGNLYLPTDFVDFDRAHIFSSGSGNPTDPRLDSSAAATYSLPFLTNSAHPGYAFPTSNPHSSSPKHPGIRIPKESFSNKFDKDSSLYLYFSSINNYLAETMNFFLNDNNSNVPGLKLPVVLPDNLENLTDSDGAGIEFDNNLTKPYYMTIKLSMGVKQVNAEGPRKAGVPGFSQDLFGGALMRGYLYGPPIEVAPHVVSSDEDIDAGNQFSFGSNPDNFDDESTIRDIRVIASGTSANGNFQHWNYERYYRLNLQDPAYQAYTPPYFYGDSNFVLKFTPEDAPIGAGTLFNFREVWANSTEGSAFYFDQYNTGSSDPNNNGPGFEQLRNFDTTDRLCAFLPATGSVSAGSFSRMKLDASIEISKPVKVIKDFSTSNSKQFSTAYIAPWWVCPVLDFSSSFSAVLTGSTNDELEEQDQQFHGEGLSRYSVVQNTHHDTTTGRGLWGGYGTDPYDLAAMTAVHAAAGLSTPDPLADKGIYLTIEDNFTGQKQVASPAVIIDNNNPNTPTLPAVDGYFSSVDPTGGVIEQTGSLAEKMTFNTDKRHPIGKMSSSKKISEAIVVIPYLEEELKISAKKVTFASGLDFKFTIDDLGRRVSSLEFETRDSEIYERHEVFPNKEVYQTREIIPGKHFLPIHKGLFRNALSVIMSKKYLRPGAQANIHGMQDFDRASAQALLSTDVGKMIDTLTGYTKGNSLIKENTVEFQLPPEFDFIHNSNVEPFQMMVIPFEHEFDKQDLLDIYQNTNPKITKKIETDIQEIILNTKGVDNLAQASWMPKILTESLEYVKDTAYREKLMQLLERHDFTETQFPSAQLATYEAQARAQVESLDLEASSIDLAGLGFESFLYPPTEILKADRLKDYIVAAAGLSPVYAADAITTANDFYSKIKFMVFKVKQKAVKNYDQYRQKQIAAALKDKYEVGKGNFVESAAVLNEVKYSEVYGANWPYDYFSLVETIKLDIELKVES